MMTWTEKEFNKYKGDKGFLEVSYYGKPTRRKHSTYEEYVESFNELCLDQTPQVSVYDVALFEIDLMTTQALRKVDLRYQKDVGEFFPVDWRKDCITIRDANGVVRVRIGKW